MKSFPHDRRRRGFSLLELVVGVTLILVLATFLGVGWQALQYKTDQTRCLSNLRQIGTATLQYAAEHNGLLPGPLWTQQQRFYSTGTANMLLYFIADYLGLPPPAAKARYSTLFDCPALTRGGKPTDDLRSYSVNADFFGYPPAPPKPASLPKRVTDVGTTTDPKKPHTLATTFCLVETRPSDASFPGKPHNSRPYFFFDSHVEARPLQ